MNDTQYTSERLANRTEQTDASADWRTEYAAQAVDTDLRADGGRYALPAVGSRVRDRDTDGDELLIIDVREGTRADGFVLDEFDGLTVADVNDAYDPGAPVVDAVYIDELEEALGGWRTVEDVKDAVSFGAVGSYSFPADRLAVVDGGGAK
ncbi:hypothetical protein ACOZ4I_17395 (plasmid) [Haloarcula salina]|uniref:hypothetical protein n=1 Tax=Haloarcula salina TaxID=1429914 RepID=UPI003C705286